MNTIARLAPLALVASLAVITPAGAVTNLIVNGSFETGDFTGYTHTGTTGLSNPAVVLTYGSNAGYGQGGGAYGEAVPADNSNSPSPDPVGKSAAYFVDDAAVNETISQLTLLQVGNYNIGYSAYLPQNGYNNRFDATFAGTIIGVHVADFTALQVGAQTWYNFSGVASISKAGYYLTSFVFNSNGSPAKDVVIDRIFVVATDAPATFLIPPTPTADVPEPATWAMLIAGISMVGVAARRRRGQGVVTA